MDGNSNPIDKELNKSKIIFFLMSEMERSETHHPLKVVTPKSFDTNVISVISRIQSGIKMDFLID